MRELRAPTRAWRALSEVRLRLLRSVSDGTQKDRIDATQSGECFSVGAVILACAVRDKADSSRVRDDRLMAKAREQPAYPGRMRPDLEDDATW
jgi:hypothetical protein